MEQSDCRILPDCIVQQSDWSILIGPFGVDPYYAIKGSIYTKAMQVYRVVGGALLNRKNSTTSWLINIIQVYPPHPINITQACTVFT